jgi:hypothetical protein
VVGRAVVANLVGDFEMIGGLVPESGQRRQGCRGARLVVLADEADVEPDPAIVGVRVLQARRQRPEKRLAALAGPCGRGGDVAAFVGGVGAPARQPPKETGLEQRKGLGHAVPGPAGLGVAVHLGPEGTELRHQAAALDLLGGLG